MFLGKATGRVWLATIDGLETDVEDEGILWFVVVDTVTEPDGNAGAWVACTGADVAVEGVG